MLNYLTFQSFHYGRFDEGYSRNVSCALKIDKFVCLKKNTLKMSSRINVLNLLILVQHCQYGDFSVFFSFSKFY